HVDVAVIEPIGCESYCREEDQRGAHNLSPGDPPHKSHDGSRGHTIGVVSQMNDGRRVWRDKERAEAVKRGKPIASRETISEEEQHEPKEANLRPAGRDLRVGKCHAELETDEIAVLEQEFMKTAG